jgi:hypothetical protein
MIENADTETLTKFVRKTVSGRVDLLATDEHSGYRYLKWAPYPHEPISHSTGEYVRGKVHTQTIESFWSLIKRGIMGNYHKVSKGICRSTSPNFLSGRTIARIRICSESYFRAASKPLKRTLNYRRADKAGNQKGRRRSARRIKARRHGEVRSHAARACESYRRQETEVA